MVRETPLGISCGTKSQCSGKLFGAAQGSSIAFEAGKYEYDPSAIATQDTIVLVDKPAAQTGNNHTANNFNVQYETVRFALNVP